MNILTVIKTKSKSAVKAISASALALCALGTAVAVSSTPARADVDALFTAADMSGLSTHIETMLGVGVVIVLLFVGFKLLKKGANKVG